MGSQQEISQDEDQTRNSRKMSLGWIALLLLGAAALGFVYGGGMGSQSSQRSMESNAHQGSRSLQGVTSGPTASPIGPITDNRPAICRFPNGNVLWRIFAAKDMEFGYYFTNPNGNALYPEIPGASPACSFFICFSFSFSIASGESVQFEAPDAITIYFTCGVDGNEYCTEVFVAPSFLVDCPP